MWLSNNESQGRLFISFSTANLLICCEKMLEALVENSFYFFWLFDWRGWNEKSPFWTRQDVFLATPSNKNAIVDIIYSIVSVA